MEVTFSLRLEGDDALVPCKLDLRVTITSDPNYGADRDGRRGEHRWFIDEILCDRAETWAGATLTQSAIEALIERHKDTIEDRALTIARSDDGPDPDDAWDSRHDD
jgi:hypothetical protein